LDNCCGAIRLYLQAAPHYDVEGSIVFAAMVLGFGHQGFGHQGFGHQGFGFGFSQEGKSCRNPWC
jgi:hypothetical protein